MTEIISKEPDIMFIPAYFAEGAIIMKQAQELGVDFRSWAGMPWTTPRSSRWRRCRRGFVHDFPLRSASMKEMNPVARRFDNWLAKRSDDPNVNAALGASST